MNEEQKNKLKELLAKQFIKHFGHAREIEKNNDSITPNFLNEPNPKLEEQSLTKKEKKD
ncbi:MAG: hypothetical protein KatS3mg002_0775 [Candidatus Woesearchaeota archaeon]|nr:MAG: hypothetical protein KatS3mg002_0775 [Candidatus Woesearchaeota archaeon]